jgi:hypothetical protein
LENNFIKYPNKIPTIPKSKSPNVVLSNPSEPSTGSKRAGKNEIKIPCSEDGAASATRCVDEYSGSGSGEKVRDYLLTRNTLEGQHKKNAFFTAF